MMSVELGWGVSRQVSEGTVRQEPAGLKEMRGAGKRHNKQAPLKDGETNSKANQLPTTLGVGFKKIEKAMNTYQPYPKSFSRLIKEGTP